MGTAKVGLNVSEMGFGKITVNGQEWPGVRAVTIRAEAMERTTVEVELLAATEAELEGDVRVYVTTLTCAECGTVKTVEPSE